MAMEKAKGIIQKVDFEASKRFIGKKSLSAGELVALLLLLICIFMWNKDLVSKAKFWKFWLPLVILVVAMILW